LALLCTLRRKFPCTCAVHCNMSTTLVSTAHHAPQQVLRTCRHCTPSTMALVGPVLPHYTCGAQRQLRTALRTINAPRQVSPHLLRREPPTAHGTC
jgi:hypothetical protein